MVKNIYILDIQNVCYNIINVYVWDTRYCPDKVVHLYYLDTLCLMANVEEQY